MVMRMAAEASSRADERLGTPAPPEGPPKLRHYFQFSLRTYVAIVILAALSGMLVHYAFQIGAVMVRDDLLESGYASTRYAFINMDSNKSSLGRDYAGMLENWYAESVDRWPLSQDAVDLAMRRARRLPETDLAAELPRLFAERAKGDRLELFEAGEGAAAMRHAFLFRNGVAIFSAQKLPADARWVEKQGALEPRALAGMNDWIGGVAVLASMLLVLFFFGGGIFAFGFLRWAYARITYKPYAS